MDLVEFLQILNVFKVIKKRDPHYPTFRYEDIARRFGFIINPL